MAGTQANATVDRCFAEAARIHRRMSFQDGDSDISILNREAHRRPVRVNALTFDVLQIAAEISRISQGAFDVTVAPRVIAALGDAGPPGAVRPDSRARWSDVELLPGRLVHYRRPLWIDVSGIAKGYAVDRLLHILSEQAPSHACVNAGGDLRVWGAEPEWVRLEIDAALEQSMPVVALLNESMATSGSRSRLHDGHRCRVAYVDASAPRTAEERFVSVLAPTCVLADALTKVVMVQGVSARPTLRHFAARALMSQGIAGWREIG